MPFVDHKPAERLCMHPEHNPPTHIVLPAGEHTWKCPGCGKEQVFVVPGVYMTDGGLR